MSTQIFYPHFLQLSTSTNVVRFDNIDFDPQYQMIKHMGGADPFPCFVGASSADPQISFTTPSIWDVLSVCTDHSMLADLSGEDVTLFYRKGKPKAFRQPLASAVHFAVVLQESALLSWESLSAREDQDVTLSAMLKTARKDSNTDPWQNQGNLPNLPQSLCEDIFTLGPVVLNGRLISSIHQVEWANNLRPYSRKTSASPMDPDYQSFHDSSPVITCNSNDLDELEQNVVPRDNYGGTSFSELRVYLRKRASIGMYVPDSTAEHIELVAYGGWKAGTRIGGKEPAEATLEFHVAAAVVSGTVQGVDKLFDRQLAKIPQSGVVPALAAFSNVVLNTGDDAFVSPNLDGGGIPTSYQVFSGALPAGVVLNTTSGLMSGRVTAGAGTYNATIRASNGQGNDDVPIQYDIS